MAARSTKMEMREYSVAEQELQDHILQIYGTRDNDDDMFRLLHFYSLLLSYYRKIYFKICRIYNIL